MDDPAVAAGYPILGVPPLPDTTSTNATAGTLDSAAAYHRRIAGEGGSALRAAGANAGLAADAVNGHVAGATGTLPQAVDLANRSSVAAGTLNTATKYTLYAGGGLASLAVIAGVARAVSRAGQPEGVAIEAQAREQAAQQWSRFTIARRKMGEILGKLNRPLRGSAQESRLAAQQQEARLVGDEVEANAKQLVDRGRTVWLKSSQAGRTLDRAERFIRTSEGRLAKITSRQRDIVAGAVRREGGDAEFDAEFMARYYRSERSFPGLTREEAAEMERHSDEIKKLHQQVRHANDSLAGARSQLESGQRFAGSDFDTSALSNAAERSNELAARSDHLTWDLRALRTRIDGEDKVIDYGGGRLTNLNPRYSGEGEVDYHYRAPDPYYKLP